jgi:uncharacterized damage-inducible protein DinB
MNYKPGAIGALTDEYEKAHNELKDVLKTISDDVFLETINSENEDFKSIKNIVLHITRSGYIYSNYIRNYFNDTIFPYQISINSVDEAIVELDKMFLYNTQTFEDKWLMSDEQMMKTIIITSWTTYDLEAIIEHSIVHILRHRLQIQKLITKIKNT